MFRMTAMLGSIGAQFVSVTVAFGDFMHGFLREDGRTLGSRGQVLFQRNAWLDSRVQFKGYSWMLKPIHVLLSVGMERCAQWMLQSFLELISRGNLDIFP